ncbi:MAG: type II toxin-antitoxin system RelE/ParE family toxin [Rhodospirillaceae bacterium]
MRVFKTKSFGRFAAKEGIRDSILRDAIRRAEVGLIDADLGGGVIKQRLARQGQGKSGGFRSIILFRRGATAFFVYGFAKNDRDNIDRQELRAFRLLAAEMLEMNEPALAVALKNGTIMEIEGNG